MRQTRTALRPCIGFRSSGVDRNGSAAPEGAGPDRPRPAQPARPRNGHGRLPQARSLSRGNVLCRPAARVPITVPLSAGGIVVLLVFLLVYTIGCGLARADRNLRYAG